MSQSSLLSLYFDADVLFRLAMPSHPYTAPQVLVTMAEYTLIQVITAAVALTEGRRNLLTYCPSALEDLDAVVAKAIDVVPAPPETLLEQVDGQADPKDAFHLAAALHAGAHVLVTYNLRHYDPDPRLLQVMTPGALVSAARFHLMQLAVR